MDRRALLLSAVSLASVIVYPNTSRSDGDDKCGFIVKIPGRRNMFFYGTALELSAYLKKNPGYSIVG